MKRIIEIYKNYGFVESFRLIKYVLWSKLLFSSKVRKIKLPAHVLGKRYIHFGKGFTAGLNLRIEALPHLPNITPAVYFGEHVKMNDYVHIACVNKIEIKKNVLIGSNVLITDHNHGAYKGALQSSADVPPDEREIDYSSVLIEENVWIGEFVSVLPGSKIGKGSIIATMSVVNGEIPAYSIAGGIPAKVIKTYNPESGKWERKK